MSSMGGYTSGLEKKKKGGDMELKSGTPSASCFLTIVKFATEY